MNNTPNICFENPLNFQCVHMIKQPRVSTTRKHYGEVSIQETDIFKDWCCIHVNKIERPAFQGCLDSRLSPPFVHNKRSWDLCHTPQRSFVLQAYMNSNKGTVHCSKIPPHLSLSMHSDNTFFSSHSRST